MLPTRLPHTNWDHVAMACSLALALAILWAFAPVLVQKRSLIARRVAAAALIVELVAAAIAAGFSNWFSAPILSTNPAASQYRIATNWESAYVRPDQKRAAIAQVVAEQTGATLLSTPDPWDEGDGLLDWLLFPDSSAETTVGIEVMDDQRMVVSCRLTLGEATWRGQPVTIDCGEHKTKSHTPSVTMLAGRDDKELDEELRRYGWSMDSPSDRASYSRIRQFDAIDPSGKTRACHVAPAWQPQQSALDFLRGTREQLVLECALDRDEDLTYEVPDLIEKRA